MAQSFHRLGYRKLSALNTAQQDLNTIDLEHKLCIGQGGAGKDPDKALSCYKEKKEDVLDFMRYSFGEDFDRIFICAGAGGGTGAGTLVPLIDTALELYDIVSCSSHKVGVILALPKISEGKRVNANAYNTLSQVYDLVGQGKVSPLIILDNEKINKLYPGLAVAPFWETANSSIAGLFHLFNHISSKDSSYSSFDPNDFKHVLDSGLIVFGAAPITGWDNPMTLTKSIRDNVKKNVLSDGIDVSTGQTAAVIMIGGNEILQQVPQENLDKGFEQFSRMLGKGSTVHRGIYSGNVDNLTVYTAIGGMARPESKLKTLKELGDLV
jgi:cell division GTPase FtsZ